MERDIMLQLDAWKASPHRKPLLLKGARQVGKTWALKEFGRTRFKNCAYFSLESTAPGIASEYAPFFEATNDPDRIVSNLSLASGQPITGGTTLLVLDEIQDCPAAVGALKYFCELRPELHVACAGSLLGVKLSRSEAAFPVGKVEFMDMGPLTFSEYLRAAGEAGLDAFASQIDALAPVPALFATRLQEQLQRFFMTGGMPEAVERWTQTGDVGAVDKVLSDLIDSYERDFAKHGGSGQFAKLSLVWNSLPSQLARENKRFVYGVVRQGARAREYENAIEWLIGAGLVRRVRHNSAHGIPQAAYDSASAFKLYALDVGVLRRLSRLDATAFASAPALFTEFKGAFAESYALQALAPQLDAEPRYWTNEKPRHEVDFLVQVRNGIVPIEVKAGEAVKSASLRYYAKRHEDTTPLCVRLSQRNLSLDGTVLNIPLYLAHRTTDFVNLALAR